MEKRVIHRNIKNTFSGNFKLGDNTCHNLEVLAVLNEVSQGLPSEKKEMLEKPKILLLVSVIEALVYDFYYRAYHFHQEGIKNVSSDVLVSIRQEWKQKRLRRFAHFIESARQHRLFGGDDNFFESLVALKDLRNRIHIQNEAGNFEPDEPVAFNIARRMAAEQIVERLLIYCTEEHPRPEGCRHVRDFVLSW